MVSSIFSIFVSSTIDLCEDSSIFGITTAFIPLIIFKNKEYTFNSVTSLFGIIVFVGVIYHSIINVRMGSIWELIYLLIITILTDTFAYLGGKFFGKTKLLERISPNKTIEGSLTGLIVSTSIASVFYLYVINPGINVGIVVLTSFLLSIIGQVGDLVFSAIKREFEIKDFSNIIPGHGGMFDRFDSIAFVSLFYIIVRLLFL